MDIKSILDDIGDIYDYSGALFLDTAQGKILINLIIILLIVIIFCTTISVYWKIFSKIKPWDKANLELEKAYFEFCNGQKEVRALYFDITGILKLLITEHFKINVIGKTDKEVIKKISNANIDQDTVKSIDELFYRAQSIKFSSQDQVKDQVLSDVSMTKTLLKEWALKNKR